MLSKSETFSNCCNAGFDPNQEVCTKCFEHCEAVTDTDAIDPILKVSKYS